MYKHEVIKFVVDKYKNLNLNQDLDILKGRPDISNLFASTSIPIDAPIKTLIVPFFRWDVTDNM
jgi:hypothetical protein